MVSQSFQLRGRFIARLSRPFLLDAEYSDQDWVARLELGTTLEMVDHEDDVRHSHPKVQELRNLSKWSDGHVCISPEQHRNLIAGFKNQVDWIPLSTGSIHPTRGRTLAIAQACGGSQSFNPVNSLRILGEQMRMLAIPNQSSIPISYKQFTDEDTDEGRSRLMPGGNRDRLVHCMEEFVKYTLVVRPHSDLFGDRYSKREQRRIKEEKTKPLNGKSHISLTNM
ncbi:hypothetical protein COCMIDRAFT_41505 [Bipolaris oryzae ATCC 44560]|uniref:NADPH-dependent FMN reductase-like domain-containing protein n=1 Tax=Bipolaris oryzae ATCC 44560 TaxID=930090 RepID=W6YLN0_COCMI|nr:uncharacterized protein COCMIDRAFT_41505 [Bipolaris oryzae ATCC 44560]EUC40117.1 hypothetical protein COCMIDRAFT_41505 [Bipolaris oryzae ATCC 44560]